MKLTDMRVIATPIRFDPSTNRYTPELALGDRVSDCKNEFIVTRRSGFIIELDRVTIAGPKVYGGRSVDPYSPEFAGDLFKCV